MGIGTSFYWDRGTEQSVPGRWHVKMRTPEGIVEFTDLVLTNITSNQNPPATDVAMAEAQSQFPTNMIEWAIWEPDRYGVWAPGLNNQG